MRETLNQLTAYDGIAQVLTIVLLSVYGMVMISALPGRMSKCWKALISFPFGIAAYMLCGYLILLTGVSFGTVSVVSLMAIVLAAALAAGIKGKNFEKPDIKILVLWIAATTAFAIFACYGGLSLAVSNDSVYYYSAYPRMLVAQGRYAKSFDTFLTDVGQTTAVLNCLPFLFGFDATFGIQHFMNFNFLAIFLMALYEKAAEVFAPKKAFIAAAAGTFFLMSSTPYLVVSKWVLSNVYFMIFAFIIFYMIVRNSKAEFSAKWAMVEFVMFAVFSMLRMEGGVISLLMIFMASSLEYTNKRIVLNYILPVLLAESGYYLMLFIRLGVDPLYSFLDWKKAVFMVGIIVISALYFILIRGRHFSFITENIGVWIVIAGILGNAGICLISHTRYLTNLYAFYQNVRGRHGWGYFGVVMAAAALWIVVDFIRNKFKYISYTDAFTAALVLVIIAVCWARGGVLVVRTSDSGNRVLLETVPFIVFLIYEKLLICTSVKNK